MVAALELYVDHTARKRLRTLWNAFEDAGIPSLRDLTHGRHQPHMSLAGAPAFDPAAVAEALTGFSVVPEFSLTLDHVGLFLGRVVWLGPVPTFDLLSHHAAVTGRLTASGIDVDPYYLPGRWVPHCTVSMRVPHKVMTDAIKLCMDFLPIELTFTGAAVADYARDIHVPL